MRKNIFEKSEKFFTNTGTFLNFDPVLYMESKKQNKKIKEENILKKEEIGISETASENKKRRGRPTVYQRDHREDMKAICESDIDRTHRTHISEYYRGAVFGLLEDNSDIPYLEKIFRIDNSRPACYQKGEIIEQLGRMLVQDGYSEDSVIEAATIAAKLYRMGYTVKEIKAYLIRVRKTGSW